jgi:hypothetical protein
MMFVMFVKQPVTCLLRGFQPEAYGLSTQNIHTISFWILSFWVVGYYTPRILRRPFCRNFSTPYVEVLVGCGRYRRKPGISVALAYGETDTCEKGFTEHVYTSMPNWANQEHKKTPAKPESPADASLSLRAAISIVAGINSI